MIFNLFRIIADCAHALSKFILIWAIHWNRSAEVDLPNSAQILLTTAVLTLHPGRLPHHTSAVPPRVLHAVSRSTVDTAVRELHVYLALLLQALLHCVERLHHLLDDECVCAD